MFSFFSVLSMMEINKINYLWDSEFFRWGGDPAGSDWDNDVWVLHHIMWISFIFHHTNLRILHKHNCNAVGVRCQAILAVCSVKSFYVKSLRAQKFSSKELLCRDLSSLLSSQCAPSISNLFGASLLLILLLKFSPQFPFAPQLRQQMSWRSLWVTHSSTQLFIFSFFHQKFIFRTRAEIG